MARLSPHTEVQIPSKEYTSFPCSTTNITSDSVLLQLEIFDSQACNKALTYPTTIPTSNILVVQLIDPLSPLMSIDEDWCIGLGKQTSKTCRTPTSKRYGRT